MTRIEEKGIPLRHRLRLGLALLSLATVASLMSPGAAFGREVGPATAPKLPDFSDVTQASKDSFKPKATAYFWLLNYDGKLRFDDAAGGKGDDLTTSGDVGVPKGKGTPGMEFELVLSDTHILRADVVKQSFAGNMVRERPLLVNGVSYPAGATVSGTFDYLMVTPSYGYRFDQNEFGYLAARGGFSYVSLNGSITTADTPTNGLSHQLFAPFLGFEFSYSPAPWIGVRFDIDALPFGATPYLNGMALIIIRPTKKLEGALGWRYLSVGDEQARYSFTSTFDGPLATLALSF
ncbi:MAG: hypothetical protein HQK87_05285 [Nitrospinae bacterium]|nr:hypothetical protein [Nitrospinota bacterium]